jgi:hypothetical protein
MLTGKDTIFWPKKEHFCSSSYMYVSKHKTDVDCPVFLVLLTAEENRHRNGKKFCGCDFKISQNMPCKTMSAKTDSCVLHFGLQIIQCKYMNPIKFGINGLDRDCRRLFLHLSGGKQLQSGTSARTLFFSRSRWSWNSLADIPPKPLFVFWQASPAVASDCCGDHGCFASLFNININMLS